MRIIHALRRYLFNFLALSKPIVPDAIVVEDWLHDRFVSRVAQRALADRRVVIIIAALPRPDRSDSPGERLANQIADSGVDRSRIYLVSGSQGVRHKTADRAMAVQSWLDSNRTIGSVELMSVGYHARKTYRIFRRIIDSGVAIGMHPLLSESGHLGLTFGRSEGFYRIFEGIIGWLYGSMWPFRLTIPRELPTDGARSKDGP